MKNNKSKKRTEATLSLIVTSALVITLALSVASAIRKSDTTKEHNNIVNLNETESNNLSANNEKSNNQSNTNESKIHEITDSDILTVDDIKSAVNEDSNNTTSEENNIANTPSSENTDTSEVPVAAPDSVSTSYSFSEADTLTMPVNGEIILSYNMDSTIWFPTLGVYKCNPGLYISSAVGTNVCASASGTVASITQNEELGNIVTIDMGNGYMASYGQLENISVAEGEVVLSGQTIGTVAAPTVYYTTEGSGVYFKLTKNDTPENPLEYME